MKSYREATMHLFLHAMVVYKVGDQLLLA